MAVEDVEGHALVDGQVDDVVDDVLRLVRVQLVEGGRRVQGGPPVRRLHQVELGGAPVRVHPQGVQRLQEVDGVLLRKFF